MQVRGKWGQTLELSRDSAVCRRESDRAIWLYHFIEHYAHGLSEAKQHAKSNHNFVSGCGQRSDEPSDDFNRLGTPDPLVVRQFLTGIFIEQDAQ